MIWMPIGLVIVYALARSMIFDPLMMPETWYGWIIGGILQIGVSLFALMLVAGLAHGIGLLFPVVSYKAASVSLTAIRDKDGVEGRFFLGTGTIESKPYYFYYKKNSDGSVSPGKLSYDSNVRVYQEKRDDAQFIRWASKSKWNWVWLIAEPPSDEWYAVDFHVPEGTVKSGYSM